ncbi:response regulator [Thioalkalivibrio sp. ALJ24]|uniref:response regulator n=1 Tax=Thioalkalivibrio sp. ALJ24 TaxID=545276 RepID=UPI0003A325CA|nr:response regulator [Thioalkalivibrio sp. ALJ24]
MSTAAPSSRAGSAGRALSRLAVLVVDDFSNMRATLREMLLTSGFEDIDLARDGVDALEKLERRRYDIVLCDYNLGDGPDGQQVLDRAREQGWVGPATVFVMVTAENSNEMVMGALEAGPDAYLSKPFNRELLVVRLQRALRRREPLRQLDGYWRHGDRARARAEAERMLEAGEGRAPDLQRLRSDLALAEGELAVAAEAARAVTGDTTPPWAQVRLGEVAEREGDLAAAEEAYRAAIAATPYYMPAHDRLAGVLEQTGREREALDVLAAAVERSPKSLARQRALGRLALALGEYDRAARAWRRAMALAKQMQVPDPGDLAHQLEALIARGATREARTRLQILENEYRGHPEVTWWVVLTRLRLLAAGVAIDRTGLLAELDAALATGAPPENLREPLADLLDQAGEGAHAGALHGGGTANTAPQDTGDE